MKDQNNSSKSKGTQRVILVPIDTKEKQQEAIKEIEEIQEKKESKIRLFFSNIIKKIKNNIKVLVLPSILVTLSTVMMVFLQRKNSQWYTSLNMPGLMMTNNNTIIMCLIASIFTGISVTLYCKKAKNYKIGIKKLVINGIIAALSAVFLGIFNNIGVSFIFQLISLVFASDYVIHSYKNSKISSALLLPYMAMILYNISINYTLYMLN